MLHVIFTRFRKVKRKIRNAGIVQHVKVIKEKFAYYQVGKKVLKAVFSHVGLILLLAGYIIFGAWLFQLCEYEQLLEKNLDTNNKTAEIEALRRVLAAKLRELGRIGPAGFNSTVTKETVRAWLDVYHAAVTDAIANNGYTGSAIDSPGSKWSITSALLFALSIITTVGYGHVTPVTEFGRFLVIPYALLGILFFLIFLTDHGLAIAGCLKYVFVRVCCYGLRRKRDGNLIVERVFHRKQSWSRRDTMQLDVVDQNHRGAVIHGDDNHVPVTVFVLLIASYVVAGTLMFWQTEGWTMIQSVYFCFVTLLTIGFGDIVPGYNNVTTVGGKIRLLAACVYIVVGLALLTMGVSMVVDEMFNSAKKVAAKMKFLKEEKELEAAEQSRLVNISVDK